MKLYHVVFPALCLAVLVPGCAAYAKLMNGLPMAGNVKATNTMSVPVCKVTIYSTSDAASTYDNVRNGAVLLNPGDAGELSYPVAKDEKGMPNERMTYGARVFGCEKEAFSWKAGSLLADIKDVDIKHPIALR
jgi:hypothetical protein